MYPLELVLPMKKELINHGFKELLSKQDVDSVLSTKESILVVINSVCGCSAGSARPGVLKALQQSKKNPKHITTAFAGFDVESVQRIREYCAPFPPSSPSIGLFNNGKLVHFIERHHIEGSSADTIADNLVGAFEKYC